MAYKGTLGHQCLGDSLFRILTTRWFEGTISMRNLPKFLDLWETTKKKEKEKKKKKKGNHNTQDLCGSTICLHS